MCMLGVYHVGPGLQPLQASAEDSVCCSTSLHPHETSAIFESIESCSTPGHQYVPFVLLMNSNSEICLPTNVATVATVAHSRINSFVHRF